MEENDDFDEEPQQARAAQVPEWLQANTIPNPPAGHPLLSRNYPSIDALEHDLHQFARKSGFAVSRRRSKNFVVGPRKGTIQRVDYYCDRGRFRPSRAKSRNTHSTKSADCGWTAVASCTSRNAFTWSFRLSEPQHAGHGPSTAPTDHQQYRGFTKEIEDFVDTLSAENPGILSREIERLIRQKWPEATFIARDLENLRARQAKARQEGYTPAQAVLKSFDEQGVKYSVRFAEDDPDRIIGLLWTLPWCETQWKRFSYCLQFDNTYKTNRHSLPFFQVTGVTNTGQSFCVAFGFIDNEREDGFLWLM